MKSTMTTMVTSLTVLTVCAAAVLAGVRLLSEPKAEEARQENLRQAVVAVLPPFADLQTDSLQGMTIYRTSAGIAVESYSDAGFGGTVRVLFGFEPDGTLHGYKVISHSETPGLGAKMGDWFETAGTPHNVLGTRGELSVTKDGGQIDAITGATITSRAFLEALNRARRTAFPQP